MGKEAEWRIKEYVLLAAAAMGVYIGFKYLSPLVTPFLFAFAFVSLLHPVLEKCQNRYHIKKGFLAAGILLLVCVTAGVVLWGLTMFIFQTLGDIFAQLGLFEEKFYLFVGSCCDGIERRFGMDAAQVEEFVTERVNVFIEDFRVQVVPKIMNESFSYVKDIAAVVSFFVIMIVASVLLAKDYVWIREGLHKRQELGGAIIVGKKIFHHIGTFIRAQLIILLIISLLCALTLYIVGIEGGIVIGIMTGLMDMLPFIGTGLVLMPLAFWQILNGYYTKAVICVILYVVCAVTREFLEPKLVGERMGILPVAILFSVYAGVKLFGIFGIVKGPLALVAIYEIFLYIKTRKEAAVSREEAADVSADGSI